MPGQDRAGCHEGGDFTQQLAAKGLALRGQPTALIVGQPEALDSELLSEDTILLLEILNRLLLVVVDPTGQGCKQDVPGS